MLSLFELMLGGSSVCFLPPSMVVESVEVVI